MMKLKKKMSKFKFGYRIIEHDGQFYPQERLKGWIFYNPVDSWGPVDMWDKSFPTLEGAKAAIEEHKKLWERINKRESLKEHNHKNIVYSE